MHGYILFGSISCFILNINIQQDMVLTFVFSTIHIFNNLIYLKLDPSSHPFPYLLDAWH